MTVTDSLGGYSVVGVDMAVPGTDRTEHEVVCDLGNGIRVSGRHPQASSAVRDAWTVEIVVVTPWASVFGGVSVMLPSADVVTPTLLKTLESWLDPEHLGIVLRVIQTVAVEVVRVQCRTT